jgi:hypothetical protein
MRPEGDLGVLDQSQEVTQSKKGENDACDMQSSCWRIHARIVPGAFRFVSKKYDCSGELLNSGMLLECSSKDVS